MKENTDSNPMSTLIGKQLFAELNCARWDMPTNTVVSRTGAVLGSHPGMTRRRNEDRVAVAAIRARGGGRYFVCIVCDGVGGSTDGDLAATLAIAVCLEEFTKFSEPVTLADLIRKVVMRMDDVVRRELGGKGATTASLLAVSADGLLVATNVGDSRIYSWSPKEGYLRQVTIDDTLENELRMMSVEDAGMLDAHGLRGSLSQAIGEGKRSSKDLNITIFTQNDFPAGAILASDGAWKGCESGFASILENSSTAFDAVRRTTAFANWVGSVDNISIIALEQIFEVAQIYFNELENDDDKNSSKLTAWFADTKFSTCVIEKDAIYARKETTEQKLIFEQPNFKKSINKLKIHSRKKKTKASGAENIVLSLTSNPETKAIKIGKQTVEISTDEKSSNP